MFQSAFALKDEAVDFGDLSDKQIASSPAHSQTMVAWHQFLNDFDAVFRHISTTGSTTSADKVKTESHSRMVQADNKKDVISQNLWCAVKPQFAAYATNKK